MPVVSRVEILPKKSKIRGNRGNFYPIPLKTLKPFWGVMGGNSIQECG